jgi:hypothetical protein
MQFATDYLFLASMDVAPDREQLFNEVYDQEHIPSLLAVPGVRSASRLKREPFSLMIGGQRQLVINEADPLYTVAYEIERPDVLLSDEWAASVERGRWPSQVRPFTRNRHHLLLRRLRPAPENEAGRRAAPTRAPGGAR